MNTIAKLCWGFFNIADVARSDAAHFPDWMRSIFHVFAEGLCFAAMVLQGDWTTYWQDRAYERQLALSSEEQTGATLFA